jgi:hypothetical protein
MGRKQGCTIRIYVEVDPSDSNPFTVPVRVGVPQRHIFHEGGASISEKQVIAAHVFQNEAGEWAALLKLDPHGRIVLANLSAANRGRSLVPYVGDGKIIRVVPNDILIDRAVNDGLLQIRGLLPKEAYLIQKHFPPLKPTAPAANPNPVER